MKKLKLEELQRASIEDFKESQKNTIVLVLDNIRSLHNVGSAFRTADALAVEKICLCGITGTPPHREIAKTALGSTESVSWGYYSSTLECMQSLKADGYQLVAVEQTDQSMLLQHFKPSAQDKIALVFGNEVEGVSNEALAICDYAVEIPQFGTKHSFNISVSLGIVLWQAVVSMVFSE